jgi:FkbM family methyltransferase
MPEFKRWFSDDGDNTHLLSHDLNEDSIIFEAGGYLGKFTEKIQNKFNCKVYVFEPVKEFYESMLNRFQHNEKIQVFNYGLYRKNMLKEINIDKGNGENSTLYDREIIENLEKEEIILRKIDEVVEEYGIEQIDLLNINIEGGEFDLLRHITSSPVIYKVKNIQVQFHDFVDNAHVMRDIIQARLHNTHKLTYNYDFVWENWTLR